MKQRRFSIALSAVTLTIAVSWVCRGECGGVPKVILISIDTLRADHLSCYGYPRATSPTLEDLANRGVLFENAHAPSSWT